MLLNWWWRSAHLGKFTYGSVTTQRMDGLPFPSIPRRGVATFLISRPQVISIEDSETLTTAYLVLLTVSQWNGRLDAKQGVEWSGWCTRQSGQLGASTSSPAFVDLTPTNDSNPRSRSLLHGSIQAVVVLADKIFKDTCDPAFSTKKRSPTSSYLVELVSRTSYLMLPRLTIYYHWHTLSVDIKRGQPH